MNNFFRYLRCHNRIGGYAVFLRMEKLFFKAARVNKGSPASSEELAQNTLELGPIPFVHEELSCMRE